LDFPPWFIKLNTIIYKTSGKRQYSTTREGGAESLQGLKKDSRVAEISSDIKAPAFFCKFIIFLLVE
jgi:hypothetical protein